MELENNALSRRGLVALGGAVGGAALLGATGAITAQAAPAPGAGGGIAPHDANSPMSEPGGLPRIGSPLIGGYTYVYRNFYDFTPWENGARTFNGYGAYGSDGTLRTMFDAPPGAILRDMEWYFSATTTGSVYAGIWTTGAAYLNVLANASVAAGAAGLRALRTVVPSSSYGPYSPGTRLAAFAAGTSATFLINGVRLGFSMYPAGATMLATPTRVYDSRSGAKIGNGQTRIHSLASWIPAGATAAIVNVHITIALLERPDGRARDARQAAVGPQDQGHGARRHRLPDPLHDRRDRLHRLTGARSGRRHSSAPGRSAHGVSLAGRTTISLSSAVSTDTAASK